MKHLKFNTFLLTMLLSMAGITAAAHDIAVANNGKTIYYDWTNNNTELAVSYRGTSYSDYSNEYSGNVVIPESVTYNGATYPVTYIHSYAFFGCTGLWSVTIPNSVTYIPSSAFCDCYSLTSVTIPNSVTSIGSSAFDGCSSLTSVTIPNSVTSIGSSAFDGCSSLTSVTIPNSVTSIGYAAFSGCSGLTSINVDPANTVFDSRDNCNAIIETATNTLVIGFQNTTIPNSVTSIGTYAFSGCSGLTSVTIPNSVTSIGNSAFSGCSALTSVTIPNSVTSIGSYAFKGTAWYNSQPDGLVYAGKVAYAYKGIMPENTSISLRKGTLGIASYAFFGCSGLTSVDIPNSVTSIGGSAFSGCSSLTSVTIPNSVTSIGNSAFSSCFGLTSVTIPNSVTSIGSGAFNGTAWYNNQPDGLVYAGKVAYKYKGTMPANTSISLLEGTLGIADEAFRQCSGLTNVTIPSSVTSIGSYAFYGCSGLTSVTIPNSVTSIGGSAFRGCSGLTSVTIPNSVTSIGSYAFSDCSGLTSVDIPNSVTSIGEFAFNNCSGLMDVTIPNSVTSIGGSAFYGCSYLTEVYCYAENVPTAGTSVFNNSSISTATLHVPAASLSSYQTTEPWSGFGNIKADVLKCATPTIAFVNGILTFECETEGVEFVNTITASVNESSTGNNVPLHELKATYHVSVYAVKEGYANSDVATMDIGFQPNTGDVNGDGEVTIADAVAVVDIILNTMPKPKFYYSVGTEEVTAENYTTANDAQYKSSLSEIPETLDLSSINSQKAYILLPEGCALVIRNAQGVVGTTSVALGNGHTVHTTTSAINGSECTCMVVK